MVDAQRSNGALKAAILGLVMMVLAGYLMIWVMMPTRLYRQTWLPNIRLKSSSTYFGPQGVTFLLFMFPVLFIAALACVYLHLAKKAQENHLKGNIKQRLDIWKRPMIMKGLGVVSRIEVAFFLMFIALLVWSFATYLVIGFATITPQSAAKIGQKVWELKLNATGLRLGLIGNICLSFLFFPVTRGSSVLPLFGLNSEASVKYHIWLGHIVMTFFTAHGLCYIIYWAVTHNISEMLKWDETGVSHVAGELALVSGLGLWATTYPSIRRKMFELFFYTHHLYIIFIFFFVLHVGISYACIMLPGFYLFMIDRYLRFLQSRQHVRLVSTRILPCETLELNFSKSKGLSYTPTSIVFMNVPSISKLQWHPFTITSNSNLETEKLSVIIKRKGSWSKKLYQVLSSPLAVERLDVSVEGPYGPTSIDFLRHEVVVMVSGGSGITPFISIIRELIYTSKTLKSKIPKIILISTFKNSSDLAMLDLILPISSDHISNLSTQIQIEAFVTREKQLPKQENKNYIQMLFKPNPSDVVIAPILGPNSWLWLGAIICSSFVIYLIFIGILIRYYIFPIDHNTNKIYSSSWRSVLNMLFICICIMMTASTAFLWNKRQNAKEGRQIQNVEGTSPNGDREVEEAFLDTVNVHYGERPDLKRILFERKEASVGVLVCGPKKMRHEVANICSSGLAANLHFESISFSW